MGLIGTPDKRGSILEFSSKRQGEVFQELFTLTLLNKCAKATGRHLAHPYTLARARATAHADGADG